MVGWDRGRVDSGMIRVKVRMRDREHVRVRCGRSDGGHRGGGRRGEGWRVVLQHLHGDGTDGHRGWASSG